MELQSLIMIFTFRKDRKAGEHEVSVSQFTCPALSWWSVVGQGCPSARSPLHGCACMS